MLPNANSAGCLAPVPKDARCLGWNQMLGVPGVDFPGQKCRTPPCRTEKAAPTFTIKGTPPPAGMLCQDAEA